MAVPEQTPYIEHIGNGVTTSFALGFICKKKEHLIIKINDTEVPVNEWSLTDETVIFNIAPEANEKISIQRKTPNRRTTNYQSFNSSFNPAAINEDLDTVWLRLQEEDVAKFLLNQLINMNYEELDKKGQDIRSELINRLTEKSNQLNDQIIRQGVSQQQLQNYYAFLLKQMANLSSNKNWLASLVVDASGKNQQEINNGSIFLSDFLDKPQVFFSLHRKNRIIDVSELLITDTISFYGSLDFGNLEIKAQRNFTTAKKPLVRFLENSIANNIVLNGDGYNVRGASINNSNVSINNLTVKNTKYLAIEGNEDIEKHNLNLNNINLENVCTAGVEGDQGWGGLSIVQSVGGTFDNFTVNGCGAKAFRLRYSKNNTGKKHVYNDIKNDQVAIYLATGENNNFDDVVVTGTRNCIKMSRGEKESKITLVHADNSHIADATYSVVILLQGTEGCEVDGLTIKKGAGFGIRVEPHPAEAGDPDAKQASVNNKIKNVVVDSVGDGQLLYSVRSSNLPEMKGNEYENITLLGRNIATSGITLQRSSGTKMRNVNVSDILGTDFAASDSEVEFEGGSLVSDNDTSVQKIIANGVTSISFEKTKIYGRTTSNRYIFGDLTGGKFQLVNCPDVKTESSDIGMQLVGQGATVNLIGINQSGNRIVIGNNVISGAVVNNVTEQPISNNSNTLTSANNVTASTTTLHLKNKLLPATIATPAGATVNTEFSASGVKLGDFVSVTPISSFNIYDDISIVAVVNAPGSIRVKRKNITSAALSMTEIAVNIKIERS